jgi:Flp pilus assembly protein protease CpaA
MKKGRESRQSLLLFAAIASVVGVVLAIVLLAVVLANLSLLLWPAPTARHALTHDPAAPAAAGFTAAGGWGSDGNPHELRVEIDGSVVCSRK